MSTTVPVSSLVVGPSDVALSYLDSGAPSNASSYVTIFSVHGMGFNAHIFGKVLALAPGSGVRFVSISRRGYGDSSPFSPDELNVITQGTDDQKSEFVKARGHEIALFINAFIEKHKIPAISSDGKTGGVILLGWSLGNSISLAAIAHADTLPKDVSNRLAGYIHTVIMHDASSVNVGFWPPPKNWAPLIDTTVPEELRVPMFTQWVTGYFKHGDLSKRDLNLLSYVLPATHRPPTIFNMTEEEASRAITSDANASLDLPAMINFIPLLLASFRKACFSPSIRELFPKMKISVICGEESGSFGPSTLWQIEDDDKAHGDGFLTYKFVAGANHFVHWDEPQVALKVYLDCLT